MGLGEGVRLWLFIMPPTSKKLRELIGFGLSVRPFVKNRACQGVQISYMDSSWKNS